MTYRELLIELQQLTEDQLDDDVTVYTEMFDEYLPIVKSGVSDGSDMVLDIDHYYLIEG